MLRLVACYGRCSYTTGVAALVAAVLALSAGAARADQSGAGAVCAGPLWSNGTQCPVEPVRATRSGGVDATTSVDFTVLRPTLTALAFDWRITGDENRNARVDVVYRKQGESEWREALPLHRLHNEEVNITGAPPLQYVVPNMFSGSIFDLEPDTAYEVRATLSDPDGVQGEAVRTLTARTRPEPMPAEGGDVYHVYPFGYTGEREEPSFYGLMQAYYLEGWRHADWSYVSAPRVQPGDVILVHAGVYKDAWDEYGTNPERPSLGTPFDGTYYLTQSGTPDKPIVIKAAGDGEVVFDGGGNYNLFNLLAANYNYFEGITVRNTDVGFLVGLKNIIGSSGFTLKNSRLENIGRGVMASWSGSKDIYIADNEFIGRDDPTVLLGWGRSTSVWAQFPGFPEKINGPNGSEYAVKIYGQGHVVAHNYVAHFHDGIDIDSYADPDGAPHEYPDRIPVSMDIYNNDIFAHGDNCIEADGGARNIRVMRNRCFNQAGGALSAQPLFGGPLYFIRNVVYGGVGGTLKFSVNPAGILVYHNTFVTDSNATNQASNVHFRNNLILSHSQRARSFSVNTFTNYSSSDFNGFRVGDGVEEPFAWISPEFDKRAEYVPDRVERTFRTLEEYARATGQDGNSVMVDYDVFVDVAMPDGADLQRLYDPKHYDFRLRPGSAPVDAGVRLPNINDGYTGDAPDMGAYELGRPVPHYGPRR